MKKQCDYEITLSTTPDNLEDEMNTLIYTLSHDMRAPIVTLCGLVDELTISLEDLSEYVAEIVSNSNINQQTQVNKIIDDIPEIKGYIDQSVAQLDHYLQDLLVLSRLGRIGLVKSNIQSDKLTHNILNELKDRYDFQITVNDLPQCYADANVFSDIFRHVLENAFQYRHSNHDCSVNIEGKIAGDYIHFQVSDNGRGISADDCKKVFDPFFRVGWSDVEGRGMGLTYTRKLVRMVGGTIHCQSEEDIGTRIHILLPKAVSMSD